MELRPFQERFPQLGSVECRFVVLPDGGESIPAGSYAFIEYYCTDSTCDCRRVMLLVTDRKTGKQLASISFGFDRDDPLRGPFLDPMNRQCPIADEFLDLAKRLVLRDRSYVDRLERHYRMFKAALRGERVAGLVALAPAEVQERIAGRKAAKQLLRRIHGRNKKRRRVNR